jgi:FMN phosphatase YigB (HAD superfamily)
MALTDDDLARMEHRARRFQGAWTGTSGTLAADVMRLLAERQRLLAEIAILTNDPGGRVRGAASSLPPAPPACPDFIR